MAWWVTAVCIGALTVLTVWLFITLFHTGKPIRSLLSSGLQGACALAAVNVTGALAGVSLGLNWLSAVACVALGVPGVIGLLLLQVICRV